MNRFIFLTMVLRADGTVTTNSGMHSQVVYRLLGNICCADRSWIFSFFWLWKSHGKLMLKKDTLVIHLFSSIYIVKNWMLVCWWW